MCVERSKVPRENPTCPMCAHSAQFLSFFRKPECRSEEEKDKSFLFFLYAVWEIPLHLLLLVFTAFRKPGQQRGEEKEGFYAAFSLPTDRDSYGLPPSLRRCTLVDYGCYKKREGFGGGGGIWRLLHRRLFLLPPLYPSCPPFCCSRVRFTERSQL